MQQWIQFTLIARPYRDARGNVLESIEGEYVGQEEFQLVILTDEEAQTMKREVFGVEPE